MGARILPFVAPVIAKGLAARDASLPPLTVIACENAINATDSLAESVRQSDPADHAVFANCSIDRIVPEQAGGPLDVTIESFFEWVVESAPFGEHRRRHPGRDLGARARAVHRAQALHRQHRARRRRIPRLRPRAHEHPRGAGRPRVHAEVLGALAETKSLLVAKHGLDADDQQRYIDKNLVRIANPHLPDTTERVGATRSASSAGTSASSARRRSWPSAGCPPTRLVRAVRAALDFDVADDAESVELQALLRSGLPADELTVTLTGVDADHPLFPALREAVGSKLSA